MFSIIGGGVIVGLMTFAFLGRTAGIIAGVIVTIALAPYFWGFVSDYKELFAVTLAYGLSTVLCTGITYLRKHEFDFAKISERVTVFQSEAAPEAPRPVPEHEAGVAHERTGR